MSRIAVMLVPLLVALGGSLSPAAAASSESPVVRVRTVPAIPGITLTFEGRRYVTDSTGRALLPRARGVASIGLLPRITVGSRHLGANTIARFARWFTVGTDSVAAFDIFRRVSWTFVDQAGAPVPLARIERLVLRSSSGQQTIFRTGIGRPRWLFSRRVSSVRGKLVLKDLQYAVQRVTVLGTDVVNAGQQTFAPEQRGDVRFALAFFTLRVRVEDALFGSAVGKLARLELPNGAVREVRLSHGRAVLPSLPRGAYRITLEGSGYALDVPLMLSRSQLVTVPVVTYLDMVAVGAAVLVLALGLVLLGRPWLARRARVRIGAGRSADAQTERS